MFTIPRLARREGFARLGSMLDHCTSSSIVSRTPARVGNMDKVVFKSFASSLCSLDLTRLSQSVDVFCKYI